MEQTTTNEAQAQKGSVLNLCYNTAS